MGKAEKCAEQLRIRDKCEEGSVSRSSCTNGVVQNRGTVYENC